MGYEHIMALNKNGVSFLDQITHETLIHYPFTEVRLFHIDRMLKSWIAKTYNAQLH